MESIEISKNELSPQEKIDLAKAWKGAWLAWIDDDTDEDEMLPTLFEKSLGLKIVTTRKERELEPNHINYHRFTDSGDFLRAENRDDYKVIIVDGRFGDPDSPSGLRLARSVISENPDTLIIGRSAEEGYNKKFREMEGVSLVLPKSTNLYKAFPSIARVINQERGEEDL